MINFNKIVKNLCKRRGKLFLKKDIFEMIDPECKNIHQQIVDKTIYKLRSQGVILVLKAGVYVVPEHGDNILNKIDLGEKYYFLLLKKLISIDVGNNYYISGIKSLEFHMKNYEIPDKIFIINRSLNKKILLGKKEIIFKTISGNVNTGNIKKINLYSKLSQFTLKKNIDGIELRISCLELSLLESSLISNTNDGFDIGLLIKALKKYGALLNTNIFQEVGEYKYIMSMNRLKEISKNYNSKLYLVFLDIIKKNGGLFIGEEKRGI